MPRESVNPEYIETDGVYQPSFIVSVGWQRDHVGVGVQVEDTDVTLLERLYGGDTTALQTVGWAMVEWVRDNPIEDPNTTLTDTTALEEIGASIIGALDRTRITVERDGIWSTLDRSGVNRLIRILRKARDAAYGADA